MGRYEEIWGDGGEMMAEESEAKLYGVLMGYNIL